MRKLLLQPFESVTETLVWRTDVIPTVTGSEQRIALKDEPDEILEVTIDFGSPGQSFLFGESSLLGKDALIRSLSDLIAARDELSVPCWQYSDCPDSASFSTVTQLDVSFWNPTKTPFYTAQLEQVLVRVKGGDYLGRCGSWDPVTASGSIVFTTAPGFDANDVLSIIPVRDGLITENSRETLFRATDGGTVSFSMLLERLYDGTLANRTLVGQTENRASYLSDLIVDFRSNDSKFAIGVQHGTTKIETESGFPFYVSRWVESKLTFDLKSKFKRYGTNEWDRWKAILAECRGSQGEVWLPTMRDDFEVVSTVGSTAVTLKGRQYFDLWSANTLCRALALNTGLNNVRVVQIVDVDLDDSGNTTCIFHTSTGWANPIVQVSLAFHVRLSSDSIQIKHDARTSELSISAISVPTTWTPKSVGDPVVDVSFDDSGATVVSGAYDSIPNRGTLGNAFTAPSAGQRPTRAYWRGKPCFWADVTNDALTYSGSGVDLGFLRESFYSIVSIRFEATAVGGSTRYLWNSISAATYRGYIKTNGSFEVDMGGTGVLTSAPGLIVQGNRYSVAVYRTPTHAYLYIDGSMSASTSIVNGSGITIALEFGARTTASGLRIGRVLIHKGFISATKREAIRAQLEADWPQTSTETLTVDGSNASATFDASAEGYETIPTSGELSGRFESQGQLNPSIAAANGLPAPRFSSIAFNPLTLPGSAGAVPFLWAEPGKSVTYTGAVFNSNPSIGVQILGDGNDEWPTIAIEIKSSGLLGYAQFAWTIDEGVTWSNWLYTAENVYVGPFRIVFPFADYEVGHFVRALASTIVDHSAEENDLTVYGVPGLRVVGNDLNNHAAWLPTNPEDPALTRFFQRALLANGRIMTGRQTFIVVGNFGATPVNSVIVGTNFTGRTVYIQPDGKPSISSSAHGIAPTAVTANAPFIYVARFNGASSSIVVKQLGTADISATVNPVDPAAVPFSAIAWGSIVANTTYLCEGMKFHALYAVDESAGAISDSDMSYLIDGFAQKFGFPSSFAADLLTAVLDNGAGETTFFHNNSRNYQLSFVVRFDESGSDTLTLFECVNAANTAGLRVKFDAVANSLTIDMVGAATTTRTQSLAAINPVRGCEFIFDLQFTSGASPSFAVYVNDILAGSLSFTGHTFATATQTGAATIGKGRGFSVYEFMIRSDFTRQSGYLREKWAPFLWADFVTDSAGDFVTDSEGDFAEG
ncbi:virion structural protein [Caudoviricetes sp.]|nr:virion structural protein [Caudoviricetes sp.]